ncbi:phosphoribosylglycinamide formyltransferase [Namhaeicola litoreus]|uniref:Phosphoribosylglycinamide formyltransferase n=1 Tax=Namhaeicola litoreus TaxID=1052145 RepID=A0ABW3Y1W5_9FLAO
MKRIVIFASGSGTNAENIMNYFNNSDEVEVTHVVTNNAEAYVIERAKKYEIPVKILQKGELRSEEFQTFLKKNADFIVLAGFLMKVPDQIIADFPSKIVNIHPALLPKYGGKGMYGMHVHEAVVENKERFSGITIHYVNEHYDEGAIIFQQSIEIEPNDKPEDVANKIHDLEQAYFPGIIDELIQKI